MKTSLYFPGDAVSRKYVDHLDFDVGLLSHLPAALRPSVGMADDTGPAIVAKHFGNLVRRFRSAVRDGHLFNEMSHTK